MRFLTLLFAILMYPAIGSDTFSVQGKVVDTDGNGLSYASVVLLAASDSTMAAYGISTDLGDFEFKNLSPGKYIFRASFVGFQDFEKDFDFTSVALPILRIAPVVMIKGEISLDELVVEEKIIPIKINGDTVEYDPRAFKPKVDDTVEDLLKKLPGVEVDRDGSIKAQGKEVNRVFVDGKEFFGNDPTTATQNLPADAIDKIQVFDKMSEFSEFSGIDDGERNKTINLSLKKDKKKGLFGKASGSYGTNDRFMTKNNLHSFNKKTQVSVLANGNNINKSVFSFRDYIKFIGGIDRLLSGGGAMLSGNSGISFGNSPKGNNESFGGGVNMNVDFSDKTELSLNYLGTLTNSFLDQNIQRNYFNTSNLEDFNQNTIQDTKQQNHMVQGKLILKPNPSTEWRVNFKGRVQDASANSQQDLSTTVNNTPTLRTQNENAESKLYNGEVDILNSKKLGNDVWTNKIKFGSTNQTGNTLFNNPFSTEELLNQKVTVPNEEFSYISSYSTPLRNNLIFSMQGSYSYSFDKQRNGLRTTGNTEPSIPNGAINPNISQEQTLSNFAVEPGFRYKKEKTLISFNNQFRLANYANASNATEQWHWLPFVSLNQDFIGGKNIEARVSRTMDYPSLSQVFEFVDLTQVGRQQFGNPSLLPEDTRSVDFRFNSFSQFSFTSLFWNIKYSQTKNKVQNGIFVDDNGVIFSSPTNTSNEDQFQTYFSFSKGFGKLNYKWSARGVYSDGFQPNQGIDLATKNLNGSANFSVENRKKEKLEWVLGADYSQNFSIQENRTSKFTNLTMFAEVEIPIGKRLELESTFDYNFLFRDNQSALDIPLQTIGLKWFVSKDKRLTAKIDWYDVWDKTQGVFRSNTLLYGEVERANVLTSYVMFGLTYRLSKFKRKDGFDFKDKRKRRG